MAPRKDWSKRHVENSRASEQNSAGSPSPWIVSMMTREMEPTTTSTASSVTQATDDVSSTSSRHGHGVYQPSGTPWTGSSTLVTTTQTPYAGGSTPIIIFLPSPSDIGSEYTADPHVSVHPGFIAAPIIGFVVIVGLLIVCIRNRGRQRAAAAAQTNAQEMIEQPQRSVQPYLAPPRATSTHFNTLPAYSSPSSPPPIILGPILTGADSSYLTGIDTSEDAPSPLDDGPTDPFADNQSEPPPPPYRPRSVALPSFAAAGQSRLIERSPFDDPQNDADAISEMSEPAGGRDGDAMSVVSDISDQHQANVSRINH